MRWLERLADLISIDPGVWAMNSEGLWVRLGAVERAFDQFADEVLADVPTTRAQRIAVTVLKERILDELEKDALKACA